MLVMKINDLFLDRLPKIDLHGFDRDSARVMVDDFVNEAYLMGYGEIVIIHGIGSGVVKNAVQETLGKNKLVLNYHIDGVNNGCTVVSVRRKSD